MVAQNQENPMKNIAFLLALAVGLALSTNAWADTITVDQLGKVGAEAEELLEAFKAKKQSPGRVTTVQTTKQNSLYAAQPDPNGSGTLPPIIPQDQQLAFDSLIGILLSTDNENASVLSLELDAARAVFARKVSTVLEVEESQITAADRAWELSVLPSAVSAVEPIATDTYQKKYLTVAKAAKIKEPLVRLAAAAAIAWRVKGAGPGPCNEDCKKEKEKLKKAEEQLRLKDAELKLLRSKGASSSTGPGGTHGPRVSFLAYAPVEDGGLYERVYSNPKALEFGYTYSVTDWIRR